MEGAPILDEQTWFQLTSSQGKHTEYTKTWRFLFDVAAIFPLELVGLALGSPALDFYRFNRLFRIIRAKEMTSVCNFFKKRNEMKIVDV